MKLHRFVALAGLICLFLNTSGFAQTTASLSGTVTTDGAGLPGVTVTIDSPNLQGTRSAVSDENGTFYFGALPPGRYAVSFELEGMSTVTKTVQVGISQAGRVDAAMRVSGVAEAITVTAAAPSVLESTEVATNISGVLVDELPIGRNVLDGALLAPGVNSNTSAGSQLSISGSPGYDNLVMVNGVVITENVRSQALELYIPDAIQETTVLTGAISAEYGRFTGGVVNSITKSGGNIFTGSFRDSLTYPSWTNASEFGEAEGVDKTNNVYEATLGGYVMRDRLWFFLSGRKAETTGAALFTRIVPGDATRTVFSATPTTDNEKYEVKLTGQVTPSHSLVVAYYDETSISTNNRFTAVSYDLDQFSDRSDPKYLGSASYNGIYSANFLVEARYSEMEYGIGHGNGSKFQDVIKGTIVRNRADGNARWNSPTFCGVCDREYRTNDGYFAKGNYYLSTSSLGTHNIVGGFESFSEHRYSNNFQSGSNFRLFVNSAQRVNGSEAIYPTILPGPGGSATYLVWTPIFTGANYNDLQTDALFLNDKWDLNENFSFNLGVRYDKNDAVDGNGNQASKDDRISPRLSATYDVGGDGRFRFSGAYNEYVSRIVDGPGTSAQSAGSPAYIFYAYQGPAINPAGTPVGELLDTRQALQVVFDWFQSQGGTSNLNLLRANSGHSVPGFDALISDSLSSPYVREFVLGFSTLIGNSAFVKIDGIARDWKDFYGFRVDASTPQQVDPLGIPHDVAVVENTNDITREYRGIQLQSAWRPNRFNVGFNYTYSTLEGNDDQESATSGTVGNSPGNIFYPEILNYANRQPVGDLGQDQTHRLRTWVGYDVPLPPVFGAVNISLLHSFDSGLSYSAIGSINVQGTGTGAPTNLPYVSDSGTDTYYFSERGAFRLEDIHSTDLALNYSFPEIWKLQLFVQGEMLNVFDNQAIDAVNTSVTASGNSANFESFNPFTTTNLIECPQGTAAATCRTMGAHWQKGASFGQPTGPASYQTPRSYRFSVGLRF